MNDVCDGEICVECCLCRECGRKVGTPHIEVCACPPEGQHWRCADCTSRRIVEVLAPYESYGPNSAGTGKTA
jgi:hypothetical protein